VLDFHLDATDEHFEMLRCSCGAWSFLSLEPLKVFCDGVSITGPMPTLACSRCSVVRLPLPMKIGLQGMTGMAKQKGTDRVAVDVPKAVAAKPRFRFCEGVPFLYDRIDQQYIPGLAHAEDGFLTPVFFSKDILTYFYNHPDYAVSFASDTYGTIYTKDCYISFGLNDHSKLIMWLGDLNDLERKDQVMLQAHNVPSDHSIGCEFYEGQIEAVFTELSQEQRLIRTSGEFASAIIERFNHMKAYKMDAEAAELLSQLRRPVHFTEEEFGDSMETMTKLFIERIDIAPMKTMLRESLGQDELDRKGNLRELKTLQLWSETILKCDQAGSILAPLFVLYDLRVAYKHLLPRETAEQKKKSCLQRLSLADGTPLEEMYASLTQQLEQTFVSLTKAAQQKSD
jgi:hypothetical protein